MTSYCRIWSEKVDFRVHILNTSPYMITDCKKFSVQILIKLPLCVSKLYFRPKKIPKFFVYYARFMTQYKFTPRYFDKEMVKKVWLLQKINDLTFMAYFVYDRFRGWVFCEIWWIIGILVLDLKSLISQIWPKLTCWKSRAVGISWSIRGWKKVLEIVILKFLLFKFF